MNEIVKLQPSRMPIAPAVAREFEITPDKWRVLVEQIFPSAKSVESVIMALSYCRARNLDIFKKPVHIVPMWSSQLGRMVETVWPGIAEVRTTAARTGEYAGIDSVEFGPMVERTFSGDVKQKNGWETLSRTVRYPEWASVVVYRIVKGQKSAFHAKIFWEETYATTGKGELPNEMWAKRTRGQLDKCVEAAALRKAFPEELGSVYTADEMEGRTIDDQTHGVPPVEVPTPPSAPPAEDIDDATVIEPDEPETAHQPASTVPQTGPLEEPEIHAGLDRREKKPEPQAAPAATKYDDLLNELAGLLSPGMPYDEVNDLQDDFESRLDGADDATFARFNSMIGEAKQNAGF